MIFQSDHMTLETVMDVYKGKVNDIYVCVDNTTGRNNYYTVLVVKDHDTVKKILTVIKDNEDRQDSFVDMFSNQNCFCIVFDYVKERNIDDFYVAEETPIKTCVDIGLNLVVQCMASRLPYPFLALVLEQRQIQLLRDNSISLSYNLDLEQLDEKANEATCVMQCAILLRDFLKRKIPKKNITYKLLLKKIPKGSYHEFRELFKDIQLSATQMGKMGIKARIKEHFSKNSSTYFRLFLALAILLTCIALPMFISQMMWGDIPFLRVFFNTFKHIGTESLLK